MSTSPIDLSSLLQAFGLGGASNIDVNSIVSQLMQVDSQPLYDLQNQVTGYQTTISAYGALLSSVSSLNTAVSGLQNSTVGLSAASSDNSYFTATGSSTAATGTTPIQISNIASAQSLYSARFGSQTSSVADLSVNPSQQLQIQVGTNSPTIVTINSNNNTLSGLASAINSANAGVTASVVKESSNFLIQDGTNGSIQNNTIAFTYNGNNYTATLNVGNYTGTDMATEIARAMNAATNAGGDGTPFAVDYSTTSLDKFTIKNTGGADAQINWAGGKAMAQQFGFGKDAGTQTITAGSALTADNNVDGTYKLALSSTATGTADRITMKVDETGGGNFNESADNTDPFGLSVFAFHPTSYGSDPGNSTTYGVPTGGIMNMTQSNKGLDAQFSTNGVTMYRSSNTVTDAVPGVTLNLLQAETTPGASNLSVNVSLDSSTLANELSSLVKAYNSTMSTVNGLYEPVTAQTSSADQQAGQGYLNGDSVLLALQQQLVTVPTTEYGTSSNAQNNYLAAIGITTDKNGVMSFNSSVLSSAYTSANASDITNMINNFANQLSSSLSNVVNVTVPAEQQDVKNQISDAQSREATIQEQLSYEQTSLTTEYTALANYVANASSISTYLTTQTSLLTKQAGSVV